MSSPPAPLSAGAPLPADATPRSGLTERTQDAIGAALSGNRQGRFGRLRTAVLFAGPAVVTSIAYMDPGNFATNIQAGARYGYALLWVVLCANALAMLFQGLSAKLGIVTGRNLAELSRDRFPRPAVLCMWVASEVAAMATDLAEFLGGAIGLSLLLHLPLLLGMAITAVLTVLVLRLERRGFRPMELAIGALVALIALCYVVEVLVAPVGWGQAALHTVLPVLPDAAAVTVSVGIIGATVMPHALYLHSGLTQDRAAGRTAPERRLLLRFSNREVVIALTLAGLVNMAMVVTASAAFHAGHSDVAEIGTAYRTLTPLLGPAAAGVFLLSLMASGISSSAVGTMAGQMIMQGFTGARVPLWLRRALTMLPAFAVVALGVNATRALVLSQVVLSLTLPVPLVALLVLTRSRAVMGEHRNGRLTDLAAILGTVAILALNALLVVQALGVEIPGLPAP